MKFLRSPFVVLCFYCLQWLPLNEGLEFNMLFMTKCINEPLLPNTQVEVDYKLYDKTDATKAIGAKVRIEDPFGHAVYEGQADFGNVTFKAFSEGEYKACFSVSSNVLASRVRIKLEWRTGAAPIDWDAIAKKEHLDQVDAYMERFKSTIKQLSEELKEIRRKEQDMRFITEATNTRVAMFSLLCVIVCVAITIGQVWYLKRFFTKKKII